MAIGPYDNTVEKEPSLSPAAAPNLTDWANEPSFTIISDDIEASRGAHDAMVIKIDEWKDLHNATGKARPKPAKNRSTVQPKLVRRQAEWRYAALSEPFLSSDKLYDVKPVSFEDVKGALQNDTVLNWQWRTKLNRVNFIDEYIRSAVDEGTVIVRTGWKRYTKMVMEEVPEWGYMEIQDEETLMILQQAMELQQDDPKAFSEIPEEVQEAVRYSQEIGIPVTAQIIQMVQTPVEKVIDNRPTVDLIDPRNFYIDPSCLGDPDKATFAAISFETSQAELRKEPNRYKNLEFVDWQSAHVNSTTTHTTTTPTDFNFTDPLRKRVLAYEYWGSYDIEGTGELVPIVATIVGKTVIRMERNPFPDQKIPFVIENYMPKKREVFGEADAELLGDNQSILGALMRGMIDLLGRSANSQQGFAKGWLDFPNRRRFENGLDYEYNPTGTPQTSHFEHTYPEIPASAINMVMMQNNEAESLTGVKAFAGGVSGEAYGDVAAGIRGVLDAASKREMGILRRMANGIKKIGEKIIAMNAVFLTEKEVVRLTNDEFVEVNREDLAGNFDLIVDISTAEIDNKKAQDLAFMLQTMGNTVDFGIVKMLLIEIARLQRMPDLAKALEKYEPQPDPLEEKLKEIAVMKAQKEIELLDSEIDLNKAKAEKERQTADNINLKTIETETGTTHERNMEAMKGQAQGNQDLEVTKSLLKPRKKEESKPDVEAAIGYGELSKQRRNNEDRPAVLTTGERDAMAQQDPRMNLGSRFYDPTLDPAANPAINI